jgi:hypothetical protein
VVIAVLFKAFFTAYTGSTRIHEATNTDKIPGLKLFDISANLCDLSNNLVTRDHRKNGIPPLTTSLVDVRVADTGIENVDQHIVRFDGAAIEFKGG